MRKKSLGKGLGALIPENPSETTGESIVEVDIEKIKPRDDQPRKEFDDKSLVGLSDSIKKYGVVQPIILKEEDGIYHIVAGERRYRASLIAGLDKIPALIKDIDDKSLDILSLIENLQREDLSAIEEANAYQKLSEDYNMTQENIAESVGKSRSYIANIMRLLKLDEESKKDLEKGAITSSQARSLLSIKDEKERKNMRDKIKKKKANVRDVERKTSKNQDKILMEDFRNKFMEEIGSKVEFKKQKGVYKVIIDCYSTDDMEELYNRLKKWFLI